MVLLAIWIELAWIAGAAAAGTASHFNAEGLWAVFYPIVGILATILTSASAVLAWGVAHNRRPALSLALRDGLALVVPLTLITASTLSANGGHFMGLVGSNMVGLLFLGWSREVGDMRVAHFLATYAMHAVPAFALALALVGSSRRRAPVWAFRRLVRARGVRLPASPGGPAVPADARLRPGSRARWTASQKP